MSVIFVDIGDVNENIMSTCFNPRPLSSTAVYFSSSLITCDDFT